MQPDAGTLPYLDNPWALPLLSLIGVCAGSINTIAGGGSLMTLPALIFFGLSPAAANATNRVGILIQTSTSTFAFARAGHVEVRRSWPLILAACLGAILGAYISSVLDPRAFRKLIGVAMLVILALLLAKPYLVSKRERRQLPFALVALGHFLIGIYGGFLQAGMGLVFVVMSALFGSGDLLKANAHKNLIIGALTVPALVIFVASGLVAPLPGLALAIGGIFGGMLGVKLALWVSPKVIQALLIAVVVISSSKLLGLW